MGPGETHAADDLDALIGDIRREAARRRAAPDFPLDEEARLSVEMDGQGPAGTGGADVAAITAALQELERSGEGRVAQVAGLAASAVRALSVRLAELERRAGTTRRRGPAPSPGDETGDLLEVWGDDVIAAAGDAGGRTLVIGAGEAVRSWVARLRDAGADVYGLDAGGAEFDDDGPVRAGDPVDHLRTVADGALGLAAVVGPLTGPAAAGLDELADEMVRTSAGIAICAEAPWAWMEALARAGAEVTVRYDGRGGSHLLLARPDARAAG